jgi:GntR family transcriptional regulator / MocR family aminotransferase
MDAFPYRTWSKLVARVMRGGDTTLMSHGDPLGYLRLRKLIARHLYAFRSSFCEPEQILIVSSAQLALFLCATLLMNPDDSIWIEEPGYPHARLAFRFRSERMIPVPLDESGIDIEAGKALSAQPRVIYVTPTHQWPLGLTMSRHRKLALLEFAAEHGAWIMEDDYDGDLRFERGAYEALFGLDAQARVIHIGTFSETLAPRAQLAYLAVPVDLVGPFLAGREAMDDLPNPVLQAVLAEFIESGSYARHVYDMRALYQERHQLLRATIAHKLAGVLEAKAAPGGTFTTTLLTTQIDDVALAEAFLGHGYEAVPLSTTYAGHPRSRGLLLGHAVARPDQIRKGVDALGQTAASLLSLAPR